MSFREKNNRGLAGKEAEVLHLPERLNRVLREESLSIPNNHKEVHALLTRPGRESGVGGAEHLDDVIDKEGEWPSARRRRLRR